MKNELSSLIVIGLLFLGLVSCEEDFETLGSEITNGQGLDVVLNDEASVVAYSRKLSPVQTSGLQKYQLGVYNDGVYGSATINLLSQVSLSSASPTFGEPYEIVDPVTDQTITVDPVVTLDDVILYIPYFSTATTTDQDGNTDYTLDSVYGNSAITLELFESNFLLNTVDATSGFEEVQRYYSNQAQTFENFLGQSIYVTDSFMPSADEIVISSDEEGVEDERLAPGLRISLNSSFFQEKVIDQEGNEVLISNNNFRNFLRGIYFKVTSANGEGSLFSASLTNATIALEYSYDAPELDDEGNPVLDSNGNTVLTRKNDTYNLMLGPVAVNTFENSLPDSINNALTNTDQENGEENLYIKGGDGVISIIELFGDTDVLGYNDNGVVNQPNGVPDELDEIRRLGWIINEANLVFYVNQNELTGFDKDMEPERITIFDIDNSRRLVDYILDPTQAQTPFVDAVNRHLGRLERGSDGKGEFYKIRITNHVNNLIQRDSTNVRLGLLVAQDVLDPSFQELQNIQSPGIESIPRGSVQSPEGTVLYGNATANEDKRLKLQIFYTDPNQ